MRWSYLLPRFGILLIIWLVCLFGIDPALRWALSKSASAAVGAKTDIARVKTKFFPPSLALYGVAVGNKNEPFKNIFSFDSLKLAFQGRPLLEKKFMVTEASLAGLQFNTPRKTSAALPKVKKDGFVSRKMEQAASAGKEFSLKRFAAMKAGGIDMAQAKVDALQTPKLAAALKAQYEADAAQWQQRFETGNYEARVNALKDRVEAYKKLSDPLKQVTEAADIIKEAGRLKSEVEQVARDAGVTVSTVKDSLKRLDAARQADTAAIMAGLSIPSLDSKSIARYLIGPLVAGKIDTAVSLYSTTRKYIPENTAKADNAARLKTGMVIEFPKDKNYPSFAIEKMAISGRLAQTSGQPFEFSCEAGGITTQPRIYGKPAYLKAHGESGVRTMDASAVFDRTVSPGSDRGDIRLAGFPVAAFKTGSPDGVEVYAAGGTGSAEGSVTIVGGVLASTLSFSVKGLVISADMQADNAALELVRSALKTTLERINSVQVKLYLGGDWSDPDIDIETDLADEISKGLNQFIGREVEKYKQQAAAEVEKYQAQARAELDRQVAQLRAQADAQLAPVLKNVEGITGDLKSKTVIPGVKLPDIKLPKISF